MIEQEFSCMLRHGCNQPPHRVGSQGVKSGRLPLPGACTSSCRRSPVKKRMLGASSTAVSDVSVSWDPQVRQYMSTALGEDEFAVMAAALTVPPLHTCVRVNTLRTTPQEVMQQLQVLLGPDDTHTAAAVHGGNAARAGCCGSHPDRSTDGSSHHHSSSAEHEEQTPDNVAAGGQSSSRSRSRSSSRYGISSHPQLPVAVLLKGSGPHEVDLSTVTKQVLISRKAGEAVLRGAHVFVPGVLGCSSGVCAGDSVAVMIDTGRHSSTVTRGMVLPSLHQQGKEEQQQQQFLCAGIGKACVGRVEMFRLQHGVAVELTQRVYDVPSLNGQLQGQVMLQNLPSIVAASVLNPPPGSRVLDMCASPGGKTTMLAQIMGCVGQVIALDRSHAKVDDIMSLARELGCDSCITAMKMDATKAVALPAALPQDQQQHHHHHQHHHQQHQHQHQQQHRQQDEGAKICQQQQQVDTGIEQQHQQNGCAAQKLHQQQQHPRNVASHEKQNQQQQQERHGGPAAPPSGMSAKAQQRLQRRLAAMAARGHTPSAAEFRSCGAQPTAPRCPGFAPESFSHVLLDAPCTALGLKPKLQQPLGLREALEAAAYQRQLLAAAVRLVRPGGFLVYSTCSVSPAENEANVRHVLDTYPCLQLVPATPRVGGPGLTGPSHPARFAAVLDQAAADCGDKPSAGVTMAAQEAAAALREGGRRAEEVWLTAAEAEMVQRFYPGRHDTIGFFVAKFEKVCSCETC